MLRYVSFVVLCAAVLLTNVLSAQQKSVRGLDPSKPISDYMRTIWSSANGLPQNSAQALCQTRDGYLWIGTQEGLARFDGVRFTVFDKSVSPAISHKNINALCETMSGSLWCGGFNGCLFEYNRGVFSAHTLNDNANASIIRSALRPDGKEIVWIGTSAGLYYFLDGRLQRCTPHNGLPSENIFTLLPNPDGSVWVGTIQGLSLVRMQGTQTLCTTYTTAHGLMNNDVRALFLDSRGIFWIGTSGGLQRATLRNDVPVFQERYTTQNGLSRNNIVDLFEDSEQTLWIGTRGGGVMRLTNDNIRKLSEKLFFDPFTSRDGLSGDEVIAFCEDREGSLWLGCSAGSGAMTRLRNATFISYTKFNGLTGEFVWGLCEDKEGAVWMNTSNGGVNIFKDRRFTALSQVDGLPSRSGQGLWCNRDGSMWIGTIDAGVALWRNGRVEKTYSVQQGDLLSNRVNLILEDKRGRTWFGCRDGGLMRLNNNGTWKSWSPAQGLGSTLVRCIMEDSSGTVWVGTSGGLNFITPNDSIGIFTAANGLSNSHTISIYEDSDGVLWIGTYGGGLNRYKNGIFTNLSIPQGLFDETVLSILEDDEGNFWMSSNRGVWRVSKRELEECLDGKRSKVQSLVFGEADGMSQAECNGGVQAPAIRSRDGRFWFANNQGAVVVDPRKIYKNPVPPNVIVEELRVDGTLSTTATLPSTAEKLEFQYTATCLTAAERVKFKYILEGYDKDWVEAGNRRTAYYNNLPRGRSYRFRVIACNNDGVWNETGAWAEFRITPYWWETWWFYGLCVMFVSGSAYQGFRWRTSRLRAKAQELERIVDVRTKEVQEQAREIQLANTQLSEKNAEITASRERLEVMSEVGRSLTASLAVETIITNLYQRVSEVMDATVFGIGLYRPEQQELEYKIAVERNVRYKPYSRSTTNKEQFPVWCLDNRKPIFINDIDREYSRYLSINPYTKRELQIATLDDNSEIQTPQSMLYVPLLLEGSPIGVLSVQSYSRNAYSQGDLETLKTLANYAAIAIANAESTEEIIRQKAIVEEFNRNIQDSIRYAKRIQDAMLPSTETLNRLLPEHFIFFRPKDVVSGDFYWCRQVRGLVFVAAVDCTGHGVPGAFMSLIGNALLNDITQRLLDPHPDLILNELHHELQRVLRQRETNNDDGMDICLCMIDLDTRIVEFAGAMNPLYAVVQGELKEFKGTPEELGGREERSPVYTRHTLDLSDVPEGASMLYLTSDGYKDQYNESRQRFMPKRLRPLLTEIAAKPLEEQPRLLGAAIDAHRGDVLQVDDMLVLGVRL